MSTPWARLTRSAWSGVSRSTRFRCWCCASNSRKTASGRFHSTSLSANTEIPVGLGVITLFLFTLACINVFTKQLATIAGVSFTLAFFILFTVSERINHRKNARARQDLEQFRLDQSAEISQQQINVRPGNVIVACRNPFHLEHLEKTLAKTDTRKVDIVVLSVHRVTAAASGEFDLNADQIFASAEQNLFSRVVTMAEKAGNTSSFLPSPRPIPGSVWFRLPSGCNRRVS